LEAVATTLSICNDLIPPTINYTDPDPDCDLFYTPNQALNKKVNVALSNSFGFGGANAVLVLRKF
jgi:3-oxoacyl-[acyl-carrier-protein] synthase II